MTSLKKQDRNLPWAGIMATIVDSPGLIQERFTRLAPQEQIICTFLDNLFGGRPRVGIRRHRGFFEAFEE